MVVVGLATDFGLLYFEIYDGNGSLGRLFVDCVRSGQVGAVIFDLLVPGGILCGGLSSSRGREYFGLIGDSVGCGSKMLRNVGAGILSCRVGLSGSVVDDICLTLAPQPKMDSTYTVIGRLCGGISVFNSLSRLEVDEKYRLYNPIKVVSSFISHNKFRVDTQNIIAPNCTTVLRRSFNSILDEIV